MDDAKQQLQRLKKENHDLEKELRGTLFVIVINIAHNYVAENANMEQKARLMETRLVENAETIENLRQERSLLSTDHKVLQRRFAEISEVSQLDILKSQF
jgi:triphosphoribosyl-dephospho-CoA synthetase